jgi:hypothetical protein
MDTVKPWVLLVASGIVGVACGSSDATVSGGGDDAGAETGGGADATPDSNVGGETGTGGDASPGADASGGNDAGGDAISSSDAAGDAAACPDEHGKYSYVATGLGCGDLGVGSPECIRQTACAITFVSAPSNAMAGLNGDPTIASDGSFTGGSIREGTLQRSGCTGSWDAASSTLIVVCGGMSTTQSCTVTLTRTAAGCT